MSKQQDFCNSVHILLEYNKNMARTPRLRNLTLNLFNGAVMTVRPKIPANKSLFDGLIYYVDHGRKATKYERFDSDYTCALIALGCRDRFDRPDLFQL